MRSQRDPLDDLRSVGQPAEKRDGIDGQGAVVVTAPAAESATAAIKGKPRNDHEITAFEPFGWTRRARFEYSKSTLYEIVPA